MIISCLEQKSPNKSNRESLYLYLEVCNGGYKYIVVAMNHFTQQVSKNWSWKDLCRLCIQVSSSGKWVGHYGTISQHPSLTDKALLYNWKQSKVRDFIDQSSFQTFLQIKENRRFDEVDDWDPYPQPTPTTKYLFHIRDRGKII